MAHHCVSHAKSDRVVSDTHFLFATDNLCDCLDEPAPTVKSHGMPDVHNRQTCVNSPIPPKFLQDAATPGVCGSYADTLIAVNAALKEQGIPIKHFLLDSERSTSREARQHSIYPEHSSGLHFF